MHNTCDSDHFQHPIPVIWCLKVVFLDVWSPGICPRTPTKLFKEQNFNQQIRNYDTISNINYLKMFRIIIPSTWGNSTSLPSTSSRISLCKSLHGFRFTIFRKPMVTYTPLLRNLLLNLFGFSSLALWKSKQRSASRPIPK